VLCIDASTHLHKVRHSGTRMACYA
jgi:hypothetical protein